MRSCFRIGIALVAFSYGWRALEVHAQEDLVAKAQNERALVVYGTALVAQFEKFIEPFKRRYPFIKTQYSRATGEALTTKILYEVSAHQLIPDAILINNYTHRIFMKKNIITAYTPPAAKNFPAGFADKQGYWYGFYLVPYAITYNTALVAKANAPKSFDDLLNPRWKGQISLEREEYLVTQSHVQYLGQSKAIEYFKRLARQDPILVNGHSKQAVLLTAGEFPIIIYSDIARTEELKRKGAPSNGFGLNRTSRSWCRRRSRAKRSIPPRPGSS
jgi:iron(III) transport system substrate-binding protein